MDEIIDLENRRFEAMINKDAETLDEILADDLSYIHSTARVETKADFMAANKAGRPNYHSVSVAT